MKSIATFSRGSSIASILALFLAACGGGGGGSTSAGGSGPVPVTPQTQNYFPLDAGAQWTYTGGLVYTIANTVNVNGILTYPYQGGCNETEFLYQDAAHNVYSIGGTLGLPANGPSFIYPSPELLVRGDLAAGQTWTNNLGSAGTEAMRVGSATTIAAGSSQYTAYPVTSTVGSASGTVWYAVGVGPVAVTDFCVSPSIQRTLITYQPTPPPVANTSLPYYVPLASGNAWTFNSGGKFVDEGSGQLTCSCPANGTKIEQVALFAPNSTTISGSFFFTKNTPPGGTPLTNLIGVENDSGTNNIIVASTSATPNGIPVMDDSPAVNESWNDGSGDSSTITAVGGTLTLQNGSTINSVATDTIAGSFSPIVWGFAKGVGFASVSFQGQTTTLASFTVDTARSYSTARSERALRAFSGEPGSADPKALLDRIFR